jgi:hypothetical protein
MHQQALKYRNTVNRITTRLLDRQTQSSIYRYCAQSAVAYLIGTDILKYVDIKNVPCTGDSNFTKPFLTEIAATDSFVLQFMTNTHADAFPSNVPAAIAAIPTKIGGFDYRKRKEPLSAPLPYPYPAPSTTLFMASNLKIS